MTDLTDFLLARIAEDERAAARVRPGPRTVRTNAPDVERFLTVWHPDRVLAECEAKRRIVEVNSGGRRSKSNVLEVQKLAVPNTPVTVRWLDENRQHQMDEMTEAEFVDRFTDPSPPSETLKFLALPYADHPDYLEEWRP